VTAPLAPTIAPFVPEPPDADWESIRARVMSRLAADAATAWTDHNIVDPGVTLAESAAFGVADLHYRVGERHLDAWPLEARDWEQDADRHWHATLPPGSVTAIATALASPGPTSAVVLEPLVRACVSRADAVALLSKAPWSGGLTAAQRPAVIALMRARLVRQVAQEQTDLIAAAVEAERESPEPVQVRDARAAAELAYALPLWTEEITALVRRERRRLSQEALVARLTEIRAATTPTAVAAVRAALERDGLERDDPAPQDEIDIAMAAAEQPLDTVPEDLEDADGRSCVWPPHPIQALTCEPVTAEDYARRARAHAGVGRAWAVPGRLPGIAWNGLATDTTPDIAVDEDAAAITLVVERVSGTANPAGFLRAVLTTAIGPEATAPFPEWRQDVDDLEPRRLICDEVGASLLAEAPILVQATLVTAVGLDRDAVIADVRARIAAFFAAGRPESRPPAPAPIVDGPWPRNDQPSGGWIPGDPIRFTEVVDAIVANPDVWGVEQLAMKIEGDPTWVPQSAGALEIPRDAVPTLADAECIRVRFSLTTECGDA
jgi:hypothetical protein